MHIFQNGSLVIHDVAPEDSGSYTCIAGNSCNIRHTEAPLFVVGMARKGVRCTGSGRSLSPLPCSVVCTEKTRKLGGLGVSFPVCHHSPRFLAGLSLDIPQMSNAFGSAEGCSS